MIIVLILDVLITLLTAIYARYICMPSTVDLFLPPGNTAYVNSSERLSISYSSSNYSLQLVSGFPQLSDVAEQFSANRELVIGSQASFGVFEGLHELQLVASDDAIIQLSLENDYFDNVFSRREVLLLARAGEVITYNFTSEPSELPELRLALINARGVTNVRNYYYFCGSSELCTYQEFKQQVQNFSSGNSTTIELTDSYFNYLVESPQNVEEGRVFKESALIVNDNEFNELILKTHSPSSYQMDGMYDFLTVMAGFYIVTFTIFMLHKYGILYQEQY